MLMSLGIICRIDTDVIPGLCDVKIRVFIESQRLRLENDMIVNYTDLTYRINRSKYYDKMRSVVYSESHC